jgi:hypothetical protein
MRNLAMLRTAVLLLTLAGTALAQVPSGRHFQRDSRLPVTAAQPQVQVVEASAATKVVAPLPKLRSGRAWPRFHHGRLPVAAALSDVQVVDASATRAGTARRGFWGVRR